MQDGVKNISDAKKYPGVKIYETSLIASGSAVTLPGIGLPTHPNKSNKDKTETLQHEYGHILDFRDAFDINYSPAGVINSPMLKFYLYIGIPSLTNSATGLGDDHSSYWTEKRANLRAESYFGNQYIHDERNFPTN